MPGAFQIPVDIGNRALQHVGSELMDATLGFSEVTKRAQHVSSCYDKLRRAELRRNVWTFATRRTALRPVDANTLQLAATLWQSNVTYFYGSIVSDSNGNFWQSRIRDNTGNQPGIAWAAWEPYFGPISVTLYDSSQSYYSGELVYTAAGDGTYNTFRSLISGNTVHPALPNQWAATTTYLKDNVVQTFPAWAISTTYAAGATVLYTDGNIYSSLIAGNIGNTPSLTSTVWAVMPTLVLASLQVPASTSTATAPTTTPIAEWSDVTTYIKGNFVIFNAAVYLSLVNSNTGNFPNAAASTSWAVVSGGTLWLSLIDLNIGNNPASTPAGWSSSTTYMIGQIVAASDGFNYTSRINGNLNNNPANGLNPTDWTIGPYTAWTSTFTQGGGNQQWLQIGGAAFPAGVGLTALNISYPATAGPSWQTGTRNVYRLPSGYLRRAPQDPKGGAISLLGAPNQRAAVDWTYEGKLLITWENNPIVFRFVADVQDVSLFDDMFCEGLGCRIGLEVCEPLTQSTSKQGIIAQEYREFMREARLANAIEQGSDEIELDDYLACRL